MAKWVTMVCRFKAKSSSGLTRVIATGLAFGVTVSKGLRVNLFDKMGYHKWVMSSKF